MLKNTTTSINTMTKKSFDLIEKQLRKPKDYHIVIAKMRKLREEIENTSKELAP